MRTWRVVFVHSALLSTSVFFDWLLPNAIQKAIYCFVWGVKSLSEMLEAVGHEYMEEFFRCCESILAANGLLVLQFIPIPDERYDEYRRSSDFIKEYIFSSRCLTCLSRVTSTMVLLPNFVLNT